MRKGLSLLLILVMLVSLIGCAQQETVETTSPTLITEEALAESLPADVLQETAPIESPAEDLVILYTNDTHTYIDNPIGYDVVSGLKKHLQEQYGNVLLVDAGDHIQGTAYGSMDRGQTIIELMNAAGYDVATLGNHEFDYGMDGCEAIREWAEYPYVSCNFYHEQDGVRGENVLDSYKLFTFGDKTVAIVGITTPESFTKSTPAYFQDEAGNYIYGISGGEDGAALQADLQKAIDDANAAGADLVIALGHLGVDISSSPWTSEETIAGVSGLSAFIDGHSHTVETGREVEDKDGNPVLLTQTGQYFNSIGMMHIDGETGEITTELVGYGEVLATLVDENGELVLDEEGQQQTQMVGYELVSQQLELGLWCSDEAVAKQQTQWQDEINDKLGVVIGTAAVTLDNYRGDKRLVRSQETNTGDFCADALYYLFDDMGLDVDVAVMNGGGIRNEAVTGEMSYLTAKQIHTFGNVACLQTVTGQQLLDALEWGARFVGTGEECGGFLHVAGATYKIDDQWPSSVQQDDKGVWTGAPTGGYRVHDVQIYNKETGGYEPLDVTAQYNLAGYNYTLRDLGDGFNMFSGAVNVLDYVMEDYMVLAGYTEAFEGGIIDGTNSPLLVKYPGMLLDYTDVNGSGRILMEADQRVEEAE